MDGISQTPHTKAVQQEFPDFDDESGMEFGKGGFFQKKKKQNMFLILAFCLGDWKRIIEEGP